MGLNPFLVRTALVIGVILGLLIFLGGLATSQENCASQTIKGRACFELPNFLLGAVGIFLALFFFARFAISFRRGSRLDRSPASSVEKRC